MFVKHHFLLFVTASHPWVKGLWFQKIIPLKVLLPPTAVLTTKSESVKVFAAVWSCNSQTCLPKEAVMWDMKNQDYIHKLWVRVRLLSENPFIILGNTDSLFPTNSERSLMPGRWQAQWQFVVLTPRCMRQWGCESLPLVELKGKTWNVYIMHVLTFHLFTRNLKLHTYGPTCMDVYQDLSYKRDFCVLWSDGVWWKTQLKIKQ